MTHYGIQNTHFPTAQSYSPEGAGLAETRAGTPLHSAHPCLTPFRGQDEEVTKTDSSHIQIQRPQLNTMQNGLRLIPGLRVHTCWRQGPQNKAQAWLSSRPF